MEDNEKRAGIDDSFSDSPNISTSTEDETTETPQENNTPTTDGVPIDEKDIKFHSKTIVKKDNSDMFVNLDQKKVREIERAKKKKEEEIAEEKERAAKIVENEAKEQQKKIEAEARKERYKQFLEKVKKHKIPIIIATSALAIAMLTIFVIIPTIQHHITESEKAAAKQMIEVNKTDMLRIFEQVVGKEMEYKKFKEIATKINKDVATDNFKTNGELYLNGTTEQINYALSKKNGTFMVSNFIYKQALDDGEAQIIKSDNIYYYCDGKETIEFNSLEEAINKHIMNNAESK